MGTKMVLKAKTFTDAPWSSPASNLSTEAYCSVCLVDNNKSGEKVKGECHYPIRSKPGAPVNKGALRAVAANLGGARTKKGFSMPSGAMATFKRLYKAAFGHDYGSKGDGNEKKQVTPEDKENKKKKKGDEDEDEDEEETCA